MSQSLVLNNCKASLRLYPNFKINFVRRQINVIYLLVAISSLSYVSSFYHDDHMSYCIENKIMNDRN
jgi:hypothetical protein